MLPSSYPNFQLVEVDYANLETRILDMIAHAPKVMPDPLGDLLGLPRSSQYAAIAKRLMKWGHRVVVNTVNDSDSWMAKHGVTKETYFVVGWLYAAYTIEPIDPELRDDAAREAVANQRVWSALDSAFRVGGGDAVQQLLKPGAQPWW